MNEINVDVLAVMDRIQRQADTYPFTPVGHVIEHNVGADCFREARAAVAELVEVAGLLVQEPFGPLAGDHHDGPDDEVGVRRCCGVVSYRDHAPDCLAVRLRAAIARVRGKGVQEVGDG